jgi:hypothetical protein
MLFLSFTPLLLIQLGALLSFSPAFIAYYSSALSYFATFLGSSSLTLTGALTSSFTFVHGIVFFVSLVYYIGATIYWVRKHGSRQIPYHPSIAAASNNNSKIQRHVTHHALSLLCVITSLITQRDNQIVLIGLWLGEVSNPPLIMEAIRSRKNPTNAAGAVTTLSPPNNSSIPLLNPSLTSNVDLALLHFSLFIITRFLALQFAAHVVFPLATLWTTKLCACLLLAVNSLYLLEYILKNSNRNGKRKRKNSNANRNITNDWPM